MIDDDRDGDDDELFAAIVGALPPAQPSSELRARLMKSLDDTSRLERFAKRVSELIDLAQEKAQELIDAIDDPERWSSSPIGMSLFHIDGGPRTAGHVVGFVRMEPGAVFPVHTHRGDETVLIMQGSCKDSPSGDIHRAGDEVFKPVGSTHSFTVQPGPDLLYLVVVKDGFDIGESYFGPDSPDA